MSAVENVASLITPHWRLLCGDVPAAGGGATNQLVVTRWDPARNEIHITATSQEVAAEEGWENRLGLCR